MKEWTAYIKAGSVIRYAGLKDASNKMKIHASNTSPLLEMSSQASQNTAGPDADSKVFQPVQFVTPAEITDKYVSGSNAAYISALTQLQASIESIADQPPNDAAAAQTLQVAKQAEATVGQIAQSFKIDSPVQGLVQALLMAPITHAEALLKGMGPAELNGKGKALCAQINPVFLKYPFKPGAQGEATLQEIDMIFKPKEGVLWQFYEQNLQKALMRSGTHFVANPGGGVNITSSFLNFLNHASDFTEAAYQGGAGPKFNYSVKPELSPDMQSIKLSIDGNTVTYTSANSGAKPFVWPGAAPGTRLNVTFQGGKDFDYPNYPGLWSVFRFVAEANKRIGDIVEETLTSGANSRPITNPTTGQPITVRLEFIANPPIFTPGYFTFGCVSDVAR
jgi:type VI secretion system protein ImpL